MPFGLRPYGNMPTAASHLGVDPPAPHKPALFQCALHVDVIGVGVGTHGQALPQAPVNTELPDAAHLPCRRHPVDRCVGQVLGPGAVLNDVIGRLVAGDQAEHGLYGPLPHHHIADAAPDFGGQTRRAGVAVRPLVRVAMGAHERPRVVKNLQKRRQVRRRGPAYCQFHNHPLPLAKKYTTTAAGGQYALASPPMLWYTIAAKS